MRDEEKFQAFWELLSVQRKNAFALIKNYLLNHNPDMGLIPELKKMIEVQNIFLENEAFGFLDKWEEYKRCLQNSIRIQQEESMKNNFNAIMSRNFPEGIK